MRRPGALMPSSLVMRMRAAARSIGRSNIAANDLQPAHIRPQHIRYQDGAVALLIVLDHRDQRAPDRQSGAVERMNEAGALLSLRPDTRLHAARLDVAAIGAARDLAIGLLSQQPNLDVVGLARGEAHVAGAEQHDAVGKTEALQDRLGAS